MSGSELDDQPVDPIVATQQILDMKLVNACEQSATSAAARVEHLMGTLQGSLRAMTSLSVSYSQLMQESSDCVAVSVDNAVSNADELQQKLIELNEAMEPIQHVASQIREIKRTLDVCEHLCAKQLGLKPKKKSFLN